VSKTYYITTFGCQANLADAERIEHKLQMTGYKKSAKEETADLIVINSCSVRKAAMDRLYAKVQQFRDKKIILTGCFLESDRRKLESKVSEIWHPDEYFDMAPIYSSSLSANIPIMTGCNNFCTYCAVPYTRGRERSRPVKDITEEIKKLVKKGYKEIWLLGQNVNSYRDVKTGFAELLKKVNKIKGDFWIRFTSPHPKDFSDEMIKAMTESEKFAHYLNLPVQSGDNDILKKMNRPYTVGHYKRLIRKIRKAIPDITLSTDIIVGFPGETEKQFENSIKLFKEMKFDMAFISEYSPRFGTASALTMKDDIPHKEKERRKKRLNDLLLKTALSNNEKLIGRTTTVLGDRTSGNKLIKIKEQYPKNRFINVKVTKVGPWKLEGKLL